MTLTIPCYECICVPMCKHKLIEQLMLSCELVIEYTEFIVVLDEVAYNNSEFYETDNYNFDRLIEVFKCLTPTRWSLDSMYSGR